MAAPMKMNRTFVLKPIFCILLINALIKVVNTSIYVKNDRRYGTKTGYNNSFTHHELKIRDQLEIPHTKFCKPIHVDILLRHGIRQPGGKDVKAVSELYRKLLEYGETGAFVQKLTNWQMLFPENNEKDITETGRIEHKSIGNRIGKRFEQLLRSSSPRDIEFQTTKKNRTIESCLAFQNELDSSDYSIEKECSVKNSLLRFFDDCKKYVFMEKQKMFKEEVRNFRKSPLFLSLIERVKEKLGVPEKFQLEAGTVKSIYVVGATEEATYGSSPWIELFTEEDLLVLEYNTDLRSYWKRGYGHRINYEMSCPLLKNIFKHKDKVIFDDDSSKKAIFRFAHAETVLPTLAILGLFKDQEPLTWSNYHQQQDRKFRTSKIAPFSSNIGFVLYECDRSDISQDYVNEFKENSKLKLPQRWDKYMLQVLFNELPVQLPFCAHDFCSYNQVKEYYKKYINGCDFEKLCEEGKHDEL